MVYCTVNCRSGISRTVYRSDVQRGLHGGVNPKNTAILERQLLEVDETVPDPQEGDRRGVDTQEGPPLLGPVLEEPTSLGSVAVKIPQKRLLDEVVVRPWVVACKTGTPYQIYQKVIVGMKFREDRRRKVPWS